MSRMIALGNWLVVKVGRGQYADAIAGDLTQGMRAGRTGGWYWRQVIAAIAAAWMTGLRARRGRILFAAVWGALWPVRGLMERDVLVWWLRGTVDLSLAARQWMMLGLAFLVSMTYVWVGLLVYLALDRERWYGVPLRQFVRGWAACLGSFAGGKIVLLLGVLLVARMMGPQVSAAVPYFQWLGLLGDPAVAAVSLVVAIGVMLPPRPRVVAAG